MKKCQTCNNENSDDMRFCLNCGSPLPDAPIMVNFGGGSQSGQSNPGTNPYGKSVETQFGGRPQQPQQPQNYSMVPPAKQSGGGGSKKLMIAIGGVVALFLLIFVAVAGIVGYNMMKKKDVVTTNSPTPSPSSSASTSPSTSPSASPSSTKAVVSTPKDSDSPTTTNPDFDNVKVKFSKVWVDYNKTVDDELGMKVHLKFEVTNLKGVDSFAAIYFQKSDNSFLQDGIGDYRATDGRVAALKALKPGFDPTVYEDLEIFMPYDKLNLTSGKYKLKMDIDVTDKDENLIKHLTFKDFEYEKD